MARTTVIISDELRVAGLGASAKQPSPAVARKIADALCVPLPALLLTEDARS